MEITKDEVMMKLKNAKSAEDIMDVAKDCEIEISVEDAEKLLEKIQDTDELPDEILEEIAGGAFWDNDLFQKIFGNIIW